MNGGAGLVRVRLDLAYDGTEFAGWARQPGLRTVQSEVEAALATVLRLPAAPPLTVAGRTDAGVHARGQVAHVDVPATTPASAPASAPDNTPASAPANTPASAVIMQIGATPEGESRAYLHDHREEGGGLARLGRSLNGVLAHDVRVRHARLAAPGFDARFSALSRRYSYRVADGFLDPLRRHDTLVWSKATPLDLDAMNVAAQLLLGEHDFAAFCRRREGATTLRGLLHFDWSRDPDGVVIANVEADAFCHSMVRSLVGALLAVGDGRRDLSWPAALLAKGERESSVTVVAPHGLTLEEVRYPDDDKLAARAGMTRNRRG